ncbi:hypothetical protein PDJAM_G00148560 [Pangasius djambal]|uniref:Uncharacterized protein n=1 Tax=Pangasius djambal TaxID=1691987 RepID=A0ACC5ZGM8_9TELE|nr:hypothetical protein [Pangasius djambal]
MKWWKRASVNQTRGRGLWLSTLNKARRYKSLGKIAVFGTSVMARSVLCLWCCFSLAFISTSVHGALQQHSDSDDHEDHMKALSEMNSDFAFRLYKSIVSGAQSQNVFFSPLSVSMALAAVSLGAGGETHQQLLSGLGFNSSVFTSEEMHQAFLDLLLNLSQRTGVDLNVGTAVYVDDTFKPHPEFLEKLKRFYLSDGFSVDFTKTEETSNQMNRYVSEKTHKKIRKFIKDLDSNTVMYLLSYIYFKGKWSIPFDPKNTRKGKFYVDKDTNVLVQMMCETNHFYTYFDQELSTIVLRLDYNDSFSMILALPKDLTVLQEALRPHHITDWNRQMSKSKYDVYLPKLSLKASYSLINILTRMGMKDMFTDKADFTGITDEEIYVSKAVHKTTLDVDEAGATATAVTGMQFSSRSGPISYDTLQKVVRVGSAMARSVLCLWCCFSLALIYTSVHGRPEQHSASDDHENKKQALNEVNSDFAFRLYKSIVSGAQSQNVFFSPLSVSMALAAVSLGAGGETHQQLLSGLGFNSSVFTSEEMHQAFLDLLLNLNQRTGVDLNVGTAVYVNDTFKPHPEFLEKLKNFYLSDGFSVDFTKTEETSNQINKYVSEKTHGKISKFIENLDSNTIMYLLSYIYFKGKWSIPFDPKNTIEDQFHVDKDTTVPVQMMFVKDDFYSYHDHQLSVRVLRLNYNDSFSMILALPDKDIIPLEEALRPHHITKWQKWMSKRECHIYLPKLSLKTSYSLISILSEMGFKDMFTVKADFSGISDKNLLVSEAVHKATLDVDEAGAEATAVTGIGFMPFSARIIEMLKFDRPFMIFIVDQKTTNVLFMGKIVNPANSEVSQ